MDCCLLPSNVRWGYLVGPYWRAKIHHLANSGGAVRCAIVLCQKAQFDVQLRTLQTNGKPPFNAFLLPIAVDAWCQLLWWSWL